MKNINRKKYSVYQIQGCGGASGNGIRGSYNYWMSSTDDINVAHQRVQILYDRIKATKRHTQSLYGCYRDSYHNAKCKGKFEVRENW